MPVRSEAPAKQPILLVSDLGKGLSFCGEAPGARIRSPGSGQTAPLRAGEARARQATGDASCWPITWCAQCGLGRHSPGGQVSTVLESARSRLRALPRNGPRAILGFHAASGANSVGNASNGTKRFGKPVSLEGRAPIRSLCNFDGFPSGSPLATASPSVSPSLSGRFFCQLSLLGHP